MSMDRRPGRPVSRPRRIVPRWTLALGFAAIVLLAIPVIGRASSDAVDQTIPSTAVPSVINSTKVMAQTFTAGTTGQIDKLSLSLETHSQLVTGWLEIRAVGAGGTPAGGTQQPASTPIQINFPFGMAAHDFTISPPVPVTAGTQYAIVWTTRVGTAFWWSTGFNVYNGGQQWLACIGCGWTSVPTKDFGFATWVSSVTATNQPPTIASDHPAVAVNEGTAPANTGTFSDPDGDTVAITASSGTITKTGTVSGSWSWHGAAVDEGASETITITADDGNGLTSTTSFPVSVGGVAPVAHFTAPGSTAPEGSAVLLIGSATSPSAVDNTAGFNYGWSVTKNGNAFKSGTGAHWQFTPDDEGTFVVTMKATDDGGMSDTATATVTGTNVWPTAHITGVTTSAPLVVTPQETLGFTGSFSDPSALDTHTVKWNFGDGTTSSSLSTSHSYTTAGTFHVSLTVTDDDGGAGVATTTVLVQSPQQALTTIEAYVKNITTLSAGQKNSLLAKLDAASASASRGQNNTSHNQMSAFLNEIQADVKTGKVSSTQQTTLTGAIHAVEAAIGTYNRMLQWWPLEP
jgi:PKD repeat protein